MRYPYCLLLALVAACAGPPKAGQDSSENERLGPFYDKDPRPTGEVTQIRPFYFKRVTKDGRKEVNILGPFVMYREDEHFKRLRAFPNIFYSARKKPQEYATWRFIFFPFVWAGDKDFLLFPFGGKARRFLGIDEIIMVAGPLFIRSRRFGSSPVDPVVFTTWNVLWPFFAYGTDGRDGGRRKIRIWPFFGRGVRRDGTAQGLSKEGYVMWPFYSWRRSLTENSFHLWPIYGKRVTPILKEQVALWPLFHYREDLTTGGTDMAFWPFFRRATGSDTTVVERYWPLYEYRRVSFTTTEYMAWPFFRRTWVDEPHQFAHYVWANPFYRRVRLYNRETGIERKKVFVWPLLRTDRSSDGALDIKIPLLIADDAPLIRDFQDPVRPFTSIYSLRRMANGDEEQSALFGLWIRRKRKQVKQVRLVWGILGWDRQPDGRYLRLLWGIRLRLGDTK